MVLTLCMKNLFQQRKNKKRYGFHIFYAISV